MDEAESPFAPKHIIYRRKPPISKYLLLFLILAALVNAAIAGFVFYKNILTEKPDEQIACTDEAKLCPDGSSVGRTRPKCEFTPCPTAKITPAQTNDETANWKTYESLDYGFRFKYPIDWSYQTQKNTLSILKDGIKQTTINFGPLENTDMIGKKITPIIPSAYVALNVITYQTPVGSDLKQYIKENPISIKSEFASTRINGISVQEVTHSACSSGTCEEILISKGNTIIDFSIQNGAEDLTQILSTFKFLDQASQSASCSNVNKNPPEMTFELYYCTSLCNTKDNAIVSSKTECETRDEIKIENGQFVSGTDGKVDCKWLDDFKTCVANH